MWIQKRRYWHRGNWGRGTDSILWRERGPGTSSPIIQRAACRPAVGSRETRMWCIWQPRDPIVALGCLFWPAPTTRKLIKLMPRLCRCKTNVKRETSSSRLGTAKSKDKFCNSTTTGLLREGSKQENTKESANLRLQVKIPPSRPPASSPKIQSWCQNTTLALAEVPYHQMKQRQGPQ